MGRQQIWLVPQHPMHADLGSEEFGSMALTLCSYSSGCSPSPLKYKDSLFLSSTQKRVDQLYRLLLSAVSLLVLKGVHTAEYTIFSFPSWHDDKTAVLSVCCHIILQQTDSL